MSETGIATGAMMEPVETVAARPSPIERLLARTMVVTRIFAIVGGLLIVGAGMMICVEVFLRTMGITMHVTDELSNYALAIGSVFAFSHCLVERAHIRIDSATRFLPIRARILVDLGSLLALCGFFAVVAWYAVDTALVSLRRGARALTELQTPLVIPQGLWALGLIVFVLVGLVILAAACMRFMRGDLKGTQELVATKSHDLEQEVFL